MARILIADDDPTIRQLAKFACEKLGHEVLESGDAPSAVELYAQERPDLVILDMKMPNGGGQSFLRMLRASPDRCRVLVITGVPREVAIEKIDHTQVDHVLLKPFRIGDVVAAVEKLLGTTPGRPLTSP